MIHVYLEIHLSDVTYFLAAITGSAKEITIVGFRMKQKEKDMINS